MRSRYSRFLAICLLTLLTSQTLLAADHKEPTEPTYEDQDSFLSDLCLGLMGAGITCACIVTFIMEAKCRSNIWCDTLSPFDKIIMQPSTCTEPHGYTYDCLVPKCQSLDGTIFEPSPNVGSWCEQDSSRAYVPMGIYGMAMFCDNFMRIGSKLKNKLANWYTDHCESEKKNN